MARKRYSAEQIIGHLRQAEILISEGKTIGEAEVVPGIRTVMLGGPNPHREGWSHGSPT